MNNSNDYYKQRSEKQAGQLKVLVYGVIYLTIAIGIFTAGVIEGRKNTSKQNPSEPITLGTEPIARDSDRIVLPGDIWCVAHCGDTPKSPFKEDYDNKDNSILIKILKVEKGWALFEYPDVWNSNKHSRPISNFKKYYTLIKRNGKHTK